MPEDVSETTRFLIDSWGLDGHSHSYMDLQTAAALYLECSEKFPGDAWQRKYPLLYYFNVEDYLLDTHDARFVFWFDN